MSVPPTRRTRTYFPTMEIDCKKIGDKKAHESTLTEELGIEGVKLEVRTPEDYAKEREIARIAHQKTQACIQKAVERFKELAKKGINE